MKVLGKWLEANRKTQTWLAAQVGVSQATISDIIRGKHFPSVPLLKKLAKVTGLSIDRLLGAKAA